MINKIFDSVEKAVADITDGSTILLVSVVLGFQMS